MYGKETWVEDTNIADLLVRGYLLIKEARNLREEDKLLRLQAAKNTYLRALRASEEVYGEMGENFYRQVYEGLAAAYEGLADMHQNGREEEAALAAKYMRWSMEYYSYARRNNPSILPGTFCL
ncbi:MAG: hypothetical protein ACP5E4_00770 [Candidatus Aenigmatarchaeota archaeon]